MGLLKNKNFAYSVLNADADAGDLSMVVTSGHGARFPATGYFMAVIWGSAYPAPSLDSNREIVKATLTTGDTFTITRAQEGTTANDWVTGDNVALVITAGKMDELEASTQKGLMAFAIATGTNTYTAVMDPAVTAYTNGMAANIKFSNASTGVCTLGLNALTAKKIYTLATGAFVQATTGDIIAGLISTVFYDSSLDGAAGGWILVGGKITIPSAFPSGTALLFPQSSAPTGWTIDSSWSTARSLLIGNSYGSGGSSSATSWSTGIGVAAHSSHTHTTGSLALTVAQLPSHRHDYALYLASGTTWSPDPKQGGTIALSGYTGYVGGGQTHNHGSTGSGGPTTHSITQSTYSPLYTTVIRATKN